MRGIQGCHSYQDNTVPVLAEAFETSEEDVSKDIQEDAKVLFEFVKDSETLSDLTNLEDKNILYYVSGYLAKSLRRTLKCESCVNILSNGETVVNFDYENYIESCENLKSLFLDQVDRGGLIAPNDILYICSLHIWNFFNEIEKNEESLKYLFEKKPQNYL